MKCLDVMILCQMDSGAKSRKTRATRRPSSRWWLLAPVVLLNVLSALSFVQFLGAAFYYSDWGPLSSTTPPELAADLTRASQRADRFFLLSIALILLAALLAVPIIRLTALESKGFRPRTWKLLAILLCVLIAGWLASALFEYAFVFSVAVAALAALSTAPAIRECISPKGFRLAARYFVALVLCVLTASVLVCVMGILRIG